MYVKQTIRAVQKKIQVLMQYHAEFTADELHANKKLNPEFCSKMTDGLFVSNSEILDLETEISVIILRLQIECQEISGRWRFACYSLSECADILMTNGQFALAKLYLQAGVDGSTFSPNSVLTRCIAPQTSGAMAQWGQIKVSTLRKLLVCYRALNDTQNFVLVSLMLLDPRLVRFLSLGDRKLLQQSVTSVQLKNEIVTDINCYFEVQVQLEDSKTSLAAAGAHSQCPKLLPSVNSKHIHDETFNVSISGDDRFVMLGNVFFFSFFYVLMCCCSSLM